MPKTDLSISQPSFVQFGWNGWPHDKKEELWARTQALLGVVNVLSAGGNSSMHVDYDAQKISESDLILAVDKIADEILPGYNFSG